MKNSLRKYCMGLLIESAIICALFLIIINIVSSLNIYATEETLIAWSVFILATIYIFLKIISTILRNKNLYIKILPLAYVISIYAVQFQLLLDGRKENLSPQITMLTMFFIIVTCIDKIFDNYSKFYKKD